MKPSKKELEKEFLDEEGVAKKRLTASIDEIDLKMAEKAIIKNYASLLDLQSQIDRKLGLPFRKKSSLFRLIVICFGAILELNFEQVGALFGLDRNPELNRFLSKFTDIPSISEEELCKTKKELGCFWEAIKELAYLIKEDYHLFYQAYNDSEFIALLKIKPKNRPYGAARLLKGINMTRWFKSEIIPEKEPYPKSLLLRALFYNTLIMPKNSTAGLAKLLGERIFNIQKTYVDIGYSLGFYFEIPSKKTLYRFVKSLTQDWVYQLMLENTAELIRIGCADISMLLVDSSEIFGRKDDSDLPAINRARATHKMTYRIQLICDPNQIPLIAVARLGTEIDQVGFLSVKEGLLHIKKIAAQHQRKIEFVIYDAGYFNLENLKLVQEVLGAKPIFNINPRRDKHLKALKGLLEKYRKKYYEKLHDASLSIADQTQLLQEVKTLIFERIDEMCWGFVQMESEQHKLIGQYILSVGAENFLELYARRNVIEGLIGVDKSKYLDLTGKKNKILILGQENVAVRVLLILVGLQFKALTNYRILKRQNGVMKDLYWMNCSELVLNYENMPYQEND